MRDQREGGRTYRQLAHLQHEQIAPQLLEQTPHDQLVNAGRKEEGDERGGVLVHLHERDRAVVDVPQEEVVDGPARSVRGRSKESAAGEEMGLTYLFQSRAYWSQDTE